MTALESPAEIVRGLFLDSLLFLRLLPARPISLVDIGAGSGIPGLPLRLVDDRITLTLVESKRKRISFLLAVCRELSPTRRPRARGSSRGSRRAGSGPCGRV